MNNDYYTPCARCGRTQKETPLKLDYRQRFHICVDSRSCLAALKEQGKHKYDAGAATRLQRDLAYRLAQEKGVDLAAFVKAELDLNEVLYVSNAAMSAIIDGLMNRQIKKAA